MSDTARLCELLQAQAQLLRIKISAEAGIKEYEADWLPEAKKVMRDATGRFAKKGTTVDVPQQPVPEQPGMQIPQLQTPQVSIPQPQQIQQQVQNVTQNVNQEAQELKREIVNKLLAIREQAQNPEQIKENVQKAVEQKVEEVKTDIAEKKLEVSSELIELASKGLDKLVETNPEFTDKLLDLMFGIDAQEARDRLADMWEELHPELPSAIKPDPYKDLAEDLMNLRGGDPKKLGKDLLRAFKQVGYDYNKMLDDLNNMPDKPPFVQVMGKAAAMTIPIAMFLGATLAPEIGLGMLMGDNLAIILTNAAVGQFWSFAANKVMDKAEVDNPITRIGVDLLVGTAATSGALDVRGVYKLGFHRSAKIAESRVDDFLKNFDNYVGEMIVNGNTAAKIESRKNDFLKTLEESDRIVFTLGGAGDMTQNQAKLMTLKLNEVKDQELEKVAFFPFVDRKIFPPDLTEKDMGFVALRKGAKEYIKEVFKNFYNEDAVSLAVQAAAIKKKYPEKEVSFVGYCGGGLIARESSEILKAMGIKTKNNITIATPFFGMTSAQNFTNIISNNDIFSNLLRPKENFYLDTVVDHMRYFEDPFIKEILANMINGKTIDVNSLQLYNRFTEITKQMDISYIYREMDLMLDNLNVAGLSFVGKQKKVNPGDYIKMIEKIDSGLGKIYKKNKKVQTELNEMESELMKNPEIDKKTLKLFTKIRKTHEEGVETFLNNVYQEKFLMFDYKPFVHKKEGYLDLKYTTFFGEEVERIDLDSMSGKMIADDINKEIQSMKDYIKKIDEIISSQGEESSLGFATYIKNKFELGLQHKEYNLSRAIITKSINLMID